MGALDSPTAAVTGTKVGPRARPPPRGLRSVELTLWAVVLLAGER